MKTSLDTTLSRPPAITFGFDNILSVAPAIHSVAEANASVLETILDATERIFSSSDEFIPSRPPSFPHRSPSFPARPPLSSFHPKFFPSRTKLFPSWTKFFPSPGKFYGCSRLRTYPINKSLSANQSIVFDCESILSEPDLILAGCRQLRPARTSLSPVHPESFPDRAAFDPSGKTFLRDGGHRLRCQENRRRVAGDCFVPSSINNPTTHK